MSNTLVTEADGASSRRREDTLKREVVNREDHRDAADERIVRELHLLVDRHQPGLPVVRVDDRRPPLASARVSSAARLNTANRHALSG